MKRMCIAVTLALLVVIPALHAQQAPPRGNVEEQMSAEEFRAAGLDKLSQAELAALNAWLQRTVAAETTRLVEVAKEEGRQEVVRKNRGFFDFGTSEPIESTIAGEFRGFGKGRRYTLANGQVWEQTDAATLAGVRRTDPKVSIKPGLMGAWFMRIENYGTNAKVRRVE